MRPIFIVIVASLALSQFATAQHCTSWTTSTTGSTTVVVKTGAYYEVVEANVPPMRLYEETNNLNGLQRGDSTRDDTCHGQIQADFRIF